MAAIFSAQVQVKPLFFAFKAPYPSTWRPPLGKYTWGQPLRFLSPCASFFQNHSIFSILFFYFMQKYIPLMLFSICSITSVVVLVPALSVNNAFACNTGFTRNNYEYSRNNQIKRKKTKKNSVERILINWKHVQLIRVN